ncbi:PLP-dependent cysteine synthase family protein [Salinispora oceanensis]|uniref:PLP-dependent cysteine synthase family protein n=1 Tax=Salinispora oceanensis TaxID=1050199 RepID=UPI00035C5064|nr:cysteine synthase family protein [Salinispora oceanensis]
MNSDVMGHGTGTRPVAASILDLVGRTPIINLNRLHAATGHRILMKLEMLNPGGSHKVRVALSMVLAAEDEGLLVRGSGQTIIEPTGGNTGLGLAMAAAVLGYRLVLVIPDNYSPAKQRTLRSFGAEIVLSDHRRGGNSHGEKAIELLFDNPDWVLLNQQANPANPAVHERTTALEILDDLGGDLPDVMIAGVGTGGHLSGVGRVLRRHKPDLRIVAVTPKGCSMLRNQFAVHHMQGLAVGLVPANLDVSLIDEEIEVEESSARAMMETLMRSEGLAVGLSSAANVVAAIDYGERSVPGTRILTFAYDSAHDYLSTE